MLMTPSANRTSRPSPPVAIDLVLEAVAASDRYEPVVIPGLPRLAVHVPERDLIVAATTAAAPLFGNQLEAIAAEHRLDVVLLRVGGPGDAVTADLALGSLPWAVWVERGFSLYQDVYSTWLVPDTFGPAVSLGADGAMVEIVPPYADLPERAVGVARAARGITCFLTPVEA